MKSSSHVDQISEWDRDFQVGQTSDQARLTSGFFVERTTGFEPATLTLAR
jgi:hypothetical protein